MAAACALPRGQPCAHFLYSARASEAPSRLGLLLFSDTSCHRPRPFLATRRREAAVFFPLAARKPCLVVLYRLPALTVYGAQLCLTALPQAGTRNLPVVFYIKMHLR